MRLASKILLFSFGFLALCFSSSAFAQSFSVPFSCDETITTTVYPGQYFTISQAVFSGSSIAHWLLDDERSALYFETAPQVYAGQIHRVSRGKPQGEEQVVLFQPSQNGYVDKRIIDSVPRRSTVALVGYQTTMTAYMSGDEKRQVEYSIDGDLRLYDDISVGKRLGQQSTSLCYRYTIGWCGDGVVDSENGELCDQGSLNGTTNATCTSTCQKKQDGVCREVLQGSMYGRQETIQKLDKTLPRCRGGSLSERNYDTEKRLITWSCDGIGGGSSQTGCQLELQRCGDGKINENEVCDDGDGKGSERSGGCVTYTSDALGNLRASCQPSSCGDGIVDWDADEQCDDGNIFPGDGCNRLCKLENTELENVPVPQCSRVLDGRPIYDSDANGDGFPAVNSYCEQGKMGLFLYNETIHGRSWHCIDTLGTTTVFCEAEELRCGDGIIQEDSGEQCEFTDDAACGDGYTCQGCRCVYTPSCGNEVVENGEECDDGIYGSAECTKSCRSTFCGDGVRQLPNGDGQSEWCDDGNSRLDDTCHLCQVTSCGDGIRQMPNGYGQKEQCDDGNQIEGDGCENDCTVSATCGNNELDEGETCDDGNTFDGDGCSAGCQIETCGDGIVHTGEACEDNEQCGEGFACVACGCVPINNRCGDGRIGGNEACDDGANGDDTDGCTDRCTLVENACSSLLVSDTTVVAPYGLGYACMGVGGEYEVVVRKDGREVYRTNDQAGMIDLESAGEYEVRCYVDGMSSPTCGREIVVSGSCEQLKISGQGGSLPMELSFSCNGKGSLYELAIYDDEKLISYTKENTPIEKQITFDTRGSYYAVCYVDTVANVSCLEDESSTSEVIGFPSKGSPTNDAKGRDVLTVYSNKQAEYRIGYFMKRIERESVEVFQTYGSFPSVIMQPLYAALVETYKTVTRLCDNPCQQTFVIAETCGDGVVDTLRGEECDEGKRNGTDDSFCTDYCVIRGSQDRRRRLLCGNGIQDAGEACDDGNTEDGDGCSASCEIDEIVRQACGNGILEGDEVCDEGSMNGIGLCSAACTLRGFPDLDVGSPVQACSSTPIPSIQGVDGVYEYLPFWRKVDPSSFIAQTTCENADDIGKIGQDTLTCTFEVIRPDGQKSVLEKPCFTQDLSSVGWYDDLLQDIGGIDHNGGQSYIDLNEYDITQLGPIHISLTSVTYRTCTSGDEQGSVQVTERLYTPKTSICTSSVSLSSPYFFQRGSSLSSSVDDSERLAAYVSSGRLLTELLGVEVIEGTSSSTAFDDVTSLAYEYAERALETDDLTNDLRILGVPMKKLPAEEVYIVEDDITLSSGSEEFNEGKPTTIILLGENVLTIKGSLSSNLLIIAPEGTVRFEAASCDTNETVRAMIVSYKLSTITSSLPVWGNMTLEQDEWCRAGGLRIEGLLIGSNGVDIEAITRARRSTLGDWYDLGKGSLEDKVYDGASFRIDASVKQWSNLPPLAEDIFQAVSIQRSE